MSGFLNALTKPAGYLHDSTTPVNLDGALPAPGLLKQKIQDIEQIVRRGPAFKITDLPTYIDAVKNLERGTDDRLFLLEKLLIIMSRLPDSSEFGRKLQHFVIDALYKDLPHPPTGYLALPPSHEPQIKVHPLVRAKYAFRNANGSQYNPQFPTMGQAGSPYARSVPSVSTMPRSALPDSGLVFDALLRRKEFVPHPGGVSSLFFAFANLVIHSLFHTNHSDWTINDASSYLDLSPLYGSSDKDVDQLRRKDGTGRIWDDVFADSRLIFMPPATCALLVLLSRNHNYIAEKILSINERGNLLSPPPTESKARLAQDDEIFHRTRLVNCGFFMQIILGDYVGAILGLARDGLDWRLNPLETMREPDHSFAPRGQGNAVSVEFNLLYRWHATTSAQDEKHTSKMFKEMFGGKNFNEVTVEDFKNAAHAYLIPQGSPRSWTFGGLKRDANGRFNDGELAKIIQDATEWRAAAFGARGTPECLRIIEILGIEQSRSWGTCSLNEFRKFIGLKPYSTFKEWNPDPEVYTAAQRLYRDIDNLELHVGMQAEETKRPMPGAGLCPGFTISRAILADAVCLTRGDRFLTSDFIPFNTTAWGYRDCQFDRDDGSFGGMLTKLLFRTLPDYFPARSAYAHFPFLEPSYIHEHITKISDDLSQKYVWTRPPVPGRNIVVNSYPGVSQVLAEKSKFVSESNIRLWTLTKGVVLDRSVVKQVLFRQDELLRWSQFFGNKAEELIKVKSFEHIGVTAKYVDIVQDVINLIPVHWVADQIVGLAIKTTSTPRGVYRERELYKMFADVCEYTYINFDPSNDWSLREKSLNTADLIVDRLEEHLAAMKRSVVSVDGLTDSLKHFLGDESHSHGFLRQLLGASDDRAPKEIASSVFAEVIPTIAHYCQTITHVVNFYMGDKNRAIREEIVRLSESKNPEALSALLAYVHEALRLDPLVSGLYRTATVDAVIDGSINVRAGERIFASIRNANLDPKYFGAQPKTVSFNRPPEEAGILRLGEYGLLSASFFESTVPRVLGAIFRLKNLRRGPGASGQLQRFTQDWNGTPQQLYVDNLGRVTPHPTTFVVEYDL